MSARSETESKGPIGIFDSGLGGLTVFHAIRARLPQYDYCYLGDTARTPYGSRSFDIIYRYTLQGVRALFAQGCPLVILACNTASAKALRSIQQKDLPRHFPGRRVLGVIRPSVELVGRLSQSRKVGLFATAGTVRSESYALEFRRLYPDLTLHQEACPMWVPLVENNETGTVAAEFLVRRHVDALMDRDPDIDTIILACTHYPLLLPLIRLYVPGNVQIVNQGPPVAERLEDYLLRHPEMERQCLKNSRRRFLTTGTAEEFESLAAAFFPEPLNAEQIELG
ncbi:MAG: glutamate racemase [Candidatus Neomarinimicrobiota bacterium]|jgi:glutamate racemase|nr:glutamate racemase [Candidatus Neomarinimicrobiota bacterium]MDD3966283.1 glutamate racemase [Candidatus Neomarinimicrobiota bacterium]MDX9779757.1 glutamate racemase [bacterium]